MHQKKFLALGVALTFSASAGQAFAGTSAVGSPQASLNIVQDDGQSWTLNLDGLLSFNPVNGQMTTTGNLPADDAMGGWKIDTVSIIDPLSKQPTSVTALKWNSWLHADGTSNTIADPNNPWATTFTFAALGDVDPYMSYGFSAKNSSTSSQTYTFALGEEIAPSVNGPYNIYADVAGSLTDSQKNGLSFTPVGGSNVQVLSLSSDDGSSFVNAGVDVGPGATIAANPGPGGATSAYGTFSNTADSAGNYDFWEIKTTFKLSPNNDVASLSGYAEITPVPEPQNYAMLLTGLLVLSAVALRRAR